MLKITLKALQYAIFSILYLFLKTKSASYSETSSLYATSEVSLHFQ